MDLLIFKNMDQFVFFSIGLHNAYFLKNISPNFLSHLLQLLSDYSQ